MMLENVTIEEVSQKTTKTNKPFFKVVAGGKTFNAFNDTLAFSQLTELKFKFGDTVTCEYEVQGGKYNNLVQFHQATGQPQAPQQEAVKPIVQKYTPEGNKIPQTSNEYWEEKFKFDKDKSEQITRQSALKSAISFWEVNKDKVPKSAGTISEVSVIKTAETFYRYLTQQEEQEEANN